MRRYACMLTLAIPLEVSNADGVRVSNDADNRSIIERIQTAL